MSDHSDVVSPSSDSSAPSVAEVVHNLTVLDHNYSSREEWYRDDIVKELTKALTEANDPDYLSLINRIALVLRGPECAESFVTLRGEIRDRTHHKVKKLSSHMDWIAKNPSELPVLLAFYSHMEADAESAVHPARNIEAQAEAFRHIRDHEYDPASHFHFLFDYFNNTAYMDMVDRHAGHVHALLQYREERGMDTGPEMEPLDEEDFAAYLKQGAVAGGWL